MRFMLTIVLMFLAQTVSVGGQDDVGEEEIRRLIEQLGHPQFVLREEATRELWLLGDRARPFLERARANPDRETVARVDLILERLRYGLFADTSLDVVALIEQYRTGDATSKRSAIQQLIRLREFDTLERFVRLSSTNEALVDIGDWILGSYNESLIPMIVNGDEESAIRLLLLVANDVPQLTITTRLLSATGRLDDGIAFIAEQARLRSLETQNDAVEFSDRERRLLASLYLANGDIPTALEFGEGHWELPTVRRNLLVAESNWEALSDLEWERVEQGEAEPRSLELLSVDSWTFAAFVHYLAEHHDRCDFAVEQLRQIAEKNDTNKIDLVKCLFAIDRYDDAINALILRNASDGFLPLCEQQRYEEAFQCHGMTISDESISQWFAPILTPDSFNNQDGLIALFQSVDVAGQLAILGNRELAKKCYADLATVGLQDSNSSYSFLREVTRQQFILGFEEDAWSQLRELFQAARFRSSDPLRGDFAIRCLMPAEYVLANFWWAQLSDTEPDSLERLRLIQKLLHQQFNDECNDPQIASLLGGVETRIAEMDAADSYRTHMLLADTCDLIGLDSNAIEHYEAAHDLGETSASLRLGDLYFERKDYLNANRWYRTAFDANPHLSIAGYLQAYCIRQMAEQNDRLSEADRRAELERSEELRHRATLVSLLNVHSNSLADSLEIRGMLDEAQPIWQQIIAADMPLSLPAIEAMNRRASHLSDRLPDQAAQYWERALVGRLESPRVLSSSEFLLNAERIHHAKATDLLNRNLPQQAWSHIQFCRAARPGSTRVAEDFVPVLSSMGQEDLADDLFDDLYRHHTLVLELFPNSALHHNNLAWFSARCQRRLDDAERHAERAVELEPDSENYLDTLAEISFLNGEIERAIVLAEQCIAINPTKEHYQQQLKRFQDALDNE